MNIDDLYPPWLSPEDLEEPKTVEVESAIVEDLYSPQEKKHVPKLVVSFKGARAKLACSQAIGRSLGDVLGKETKTWRGQRVTLYQGSFNNKPAIRARAPETEAGSGAALTPEDEYDAVFPGSSEK